MRLSLERNHFIDVLPEFSQNISFKMTVFLLSETVIEEQSFKIVSGRQISGFEISKSSAIHFYSLLTFFLFLSTEEMNVSNNIQDDV